MRAIIEKLVAGGFAYVAEDHVLFSPQAMNEANSVMPRYGALSKRSLDEMIAGARVDVAPYKRDSTDFVLWKPSKPGEPSCRSPLAWTLRGAEERARTLDDWSAIAADAEGGQPSPVMVEALYDDLNTAQAMAVLHGLRNAAASGGARERGEFAASLRLLGFLSMSAAAWKGRKQQASGVDPQQVDRLIAERAAARARKDFKESDRIRDELAAMGVAIKDGKDADGKPVTTWEIA